MSCDDCPDEPVMRVIRWKIWYDDGSVVLGKTIDDWTAAPDDGVQIVMLYYDKMATDGVTRYRRVVQGEDYYWMAPSPNDFIYGSGRVDPGPRYPSAVVKLGKWTDDGSFSAMNAAAMADIEGE